MRPGSPVIACRRRRLAGAVRPDQTDDLALRDPEAHAAHGRHGPVEPRPRRARASAQPSTSSASSLPGTHLRRRGWRGSRRAPLREVRPWSRTWIRSHTSMTSAMLWSIRSTPASCSSRTDRMTAANSGTSASGRPAAGSSSSTKRGRVARRGPPSRRSSPCARAFGGKLCLRAQRHQLEQLIRSRSRSPSAEARAERGHLDVLAHRQLPEGAAVLEGAPSPPRARRLGLQRVISRPSSSTAPSLGTSNPLSTLTSVDLPAPWGRSAPPPRAGAARASRPATRGRLRTTVRRRRPERSSGPLP